MGRWAKQLLAHRDEAAETSGLTGEALPDLSVIQAAGLLGWYRQERGILLNREWWRTAMITLARRAEAKGWNGKAGSGPIKEVWDALRTITSELDKLAPSGRLSVSDALEESSARRIPGMLLELRTKKGMPLSPPPLPSYAKPDKPKSSNNSADGKLEQQSNTGSGSMILIFIILAVLAG